MSRIAMFSFLNINWLLHLLISLVEGFRKKQLVVFSLQSCRNRQLDMVSCIKAIKTALSIITSKRALQRAQGIGIGTRNRVFSYWITFFKTHNISLKPQGKSHRAPPHVESQIWGALEGLFCDTPAWKGVGLEDDTNSNWRFWEETSIKVVAIAIVQSKRNKLAKLRRCVSRIHFTLLQ